MNQHGLYAPPKVSKFSSGLCDCCSDVSLCCMTCFCPCITFGRIAEIVDQGSPSCCVSGSLYTVLMCFFGFQWICSCTYRSKLKTQLGMNKSCMADCCTHFCCELCALCQEYRELQFHGYDVASGWHGNMKKHNGAIMTPPNMNGAMIR